KMRRYKRFARQLGMSVMSEGCLMRYGRNQKMQRISWKEQSKPIAACSSLKKNLKQATTREARGKKKERPFLPNLFQALHLKSSHIALEHPVVQHKQALVDGIGVVRNKASLLQLKQYLCRLAFYFCVDSDSSLRLTCNLRFLCGCTIHLQILQHCRNLRQENCAGFANYHICSSYRLA